MKLQMQIAADATAASPDRATRVEAGRVEAPEAVVRQLLRFCRNEGWAGYDPYDALNSRIFTAVPLLDARLPRLMLTQLLKRSPVNVRGLLAIPKTQNPKALALFLGALIKLSRAGLLDDPAAIDGMIERITALRSRGSDDFCWGYSFPWQTRTKIVPRGAPNLVCTTFVANALLDRYDQSGDAHLLAMAGSAARYIVGQLYREHGALAYFLYPSPEHSQQIHNANLLGAALLCRVARRTGERSLFEPALKVARYSASRQRADGSWMYGELPTQQWIDNFHTGYNLSALRSIGRDAGTGEFVDQVERGFRFYRAHFFREDGAARYFHDRTYPIDAHCVSQSLLTLIEFRDLDRDNMRLADAVYQWAMTHMWDERGFFYYRVLRFATIRTSYMRWTQAWMLLALAALVEARHEAR